MTTVIVIVRTRDEERRIGQFCHSYHAADAILVSDGGSTDNTVALASTFHNVTVRHYPVQVQLANGYWRNPDGPHVQWNIDWANAYIREHGLDARDVFVILDDCDCRPTRDLRRAYRDILANESADFVCAVRLYLWGHDQHFPHMAKPGAGHTAWEPSLWAWRASVPFGVVDVPPAYTFRVGDQAIRDLHFDAKTRDLFPPMSLLHFSWDDPANVDRKVRVYRESGLIPTMQHPLTFAGPLEPLADWMHE